jgi:hypothetical protein
MDEVGADDDGCRPFLRRFRSRPSIGLSFHPHDYVKKSVETDYRVAYRAIPNYYCPLTQDFSNLGVTLGYRDGSPFPIDFSYSEGPFGGVYLHQYGSSLSRQLNRRLSVSINYDGTYASSNGVLASQWLRRFSLSEALSADSTVSLEYRVISGNIGVVTQPPGSNLAVSFHDLLRNGNTLYLSYGTPAAPQTLNRFIVKYIFSYGGGAGT